MYYKTFYAIILLSCLCSVTSALAKLKMKDDLNLLKVVSSLRAPFFELPCMRIGGTCARAFACPPDTEVMQRGLCPQQQRYGMECCKPVTLEKKCSARNGLCLSQKYLCRNTISSDMTDCLSTEICCVKKS